MANINLFFETIDSTPFADEAEKDQYKAEMMVMRSMFLWIITETWGDTYLPRTTDVDEGMTASRSPRADSVSYTHLDVYKRQGKCMERFV